MSDGQSESSKENSEATSADWIYIRASILGPLNADWINVTCEMIQLSFFSPSFSIRAN